MYGHLKVSRTDCTEDRNRQILRVAGTSVPRGVYDYRLEYISGIVSLTLV